MADTNYSPILPYDITQGEHFEVYNRSTYVRDITVIGENSIKMESGNLYKYYRCEDIKPIKIGGD